jgi:hypothetical protein
MDATYLMMEDAACGTASWTGQLLKIGMKPERVWAPARTGEGCEGSKQVIASGIFILHHHQKPA